MTSESNRTSSPSAAPIAGRRAFHRWVTIAIFLLPGALIMGALLVYPIFFTFVRSTFNATGTEFIGLANYVDIFSERRTLIAVRNNLIWVVIVPPVITGIGLVLAVLSQKIPWAAVFRATVFIPLVVSGLAAGVTFRFIYASDPTVGFANAALQTIAHIFQPPGPYPGARTSQADVAAPTEDGGVVLQEAVQPGASANIGLIGIPPFSLPETAGDAQAAPEPGPDSITGTVWLDFSPAGERGTVDETERGLPGVTVQAVRDGAVVATDTTGRDGTYAFEELEGGAYEVRLAASAFRPPWQGVAWLGPLLIIPAIIIAYIWIHTGFAVIITAAGLSGIDDNLQDSARVEGANEWQVFRHITVPLLRPVLMVVLVTTIISVLKIFDLVLVIAPEAVQTDANVLALEMWRASFGGARDFGLGSALAALLFIMIVPAMVFNVRRFQVDAS